MENTKKKWLIYTQMHSCKNKEETLISSTVFVSATDQMVTAGIMTIFLTLPISYSLCFQQVC